MGHGNFMMNRNGSRQSGFTLIELMIAMLLGLLLSGALLTMLAQARQSFQQDEEFASMQDEARYAMEEISRDVSMAGYIGDILVPETITFDASLVIGVDCDATGGDAFAYRLTDSSSGADTTLMGMDNIVAAEVVDQFTCFLADELAAGTDIVATKHLSGATNATLAAGDVAVRYNGTVGSLFVHPITSSIAAPFVDRIYTPTIYFIRNYTETPGDGVPSLCRKVLVGGGTVNMVTECIAEGIEDLQVEYGVDTSGDGSVDTYLDEPTLAQMEAAVSVRIYLLARTADVDPSYTNDKTYTLANSGAFSPNDSFRRRTYMTTVSVPNVRNRLLTGL